jgi:sugar/nucleoside kinase (ribokinase family)
MVDVVGIGALFFDHLVNVARVPSGNSGARADDMFYQGGGNVATAMAASARLGAKAGIIAVAARDFGGDFMVNDFAYNGVDTSHILRDGPDSTSHYNIAISEVELGTRMFIGKRGTVRALELEDLDYDYIASAKVLHLENGSPVAVAAAKFAKEKGIKVVIDAGGYSEDRKAILPYLDVFIGSEMFYNKMFADNKDDLEGNCKKLHEMGPSVVWITRGVKGSAGYVDGKFYNVPTFVDTPVKDTTGAGDTFHGAYIAAMLEGLPHPECARYASAVSSIKCMFVGGRTGIPNRETLARFLQDGTVLTEEIEGRLAYYRRGFYVHTLGQR